MTVVGTRPELIRLSRTIGELDRSVDHILVHTGQNYDPRLSEIFFKDLGVRAPDHHLNIAAASPGEAIGAIIAQTDKVLAQEMPDAMLVLGDTNSCLSVIPAKRRKIPIFHAEAGNRCYDVNVPEEINRKIVDHTSDINIAYSEAARRNLLAEGLPPQLCFVLGSPLDEVLTAHCARIAQSNIVTEQSLTKGEYFVASVHRAETVDDPKRLEMMIAALDQLSTATSKPVILSTHPRTRAALERAPTPPPASITCCPPFGFVDYIRLQKDAACVLSDSGSLPEEAALVGFPAVALRQTHERLEAMDQAVTILAGRHGDDIVAAALLAMRQHQSGRRTRPVNAYVAPNFSQDIVRIILSYTPYVNTYTWRHAS
ncbi:MAG: UDP-N-acetyl glucosamine 2-epimerase [Pseudomonadota bacterium]